MISWDCSSCLCIIIILHFMMKQVAERLSASALCSAASLLSYITKVNLFCGLHGSSISRIIFCVSWQFCVCRVVGVCFGIGAFIEHIRDIYIICVQPVIWFTVMSVSVWVICGFYFCFFLISLWLPVSARDGSANQQTAVQLFSRPPFTRER